MSQPPSTRITANGRVCTKCKRYKSWASFSVDRGNKHGHRPWCKKCASAAAAEWKSRTNYYPNNRSVILDHKKRTYNPRRKKSYDLMAKYGISLTDFTKILSSQGGKCKICRQCLTFLTRNRLHEAVVDHCHSSGRVRGILCHTCNRAIGLLQDNPRLLNKAAKYIEAHQ